MALFDTFSNKTNTQTSVTNTDSYNRSTVVSSGVSDSNNLTLSINKPGGDPSGFEKYIPIVIAVIALLFAVSLFKRRA